MKLLLDTHVLLWWLDDSPRLSPVHREAVGDPANTVFVSAASIWEIAVKSRKGSIELPEDFLEICRQESFHFLPITSEHAWDTRLLPAIHSDPFDRLLVAQAKAEGLILVTVDKVLAGYGIPRLKG